MVEDTVIIKIREGGPLCVSKQRLTEDSTTFRYLIHELCQEELIIDDFEPEIVTLFLTLLEDKAVDHIEDKEFRELHKLSVVFDVKWLNSECRKWLEEKMDQLIKAANYNSELFVFEECLFIYQKWDDETPMKKLIARRWWKDNSVFISRYMEGYDNLKTHQLKFLLRLAGRNSKVFLEILIEQISSRQFLDDNTRFLLSNMNLKLCADQNEAIYRNMLGKITEMPEISCNDLKLVLALSVDAVRKDDIRDLVHDDSTTLYNEEWDCMFRNCATFKDLTETIRLENAKGRITFMQAVIDLSAKFLEKNPPSDEEAVEYVKTLEDMCIMLSLYKVSKGYLDSIISIIQSSDKEAKDPAINMLQLITKNSKISSDDHANVLLIGEEFVISEQLDTDNGSTAQPSQPPKGQHPSTEHSSKIGAKIKSVLFTTKMPQKNTQRNKNKTQNSGGNLQKNSLEPNNATYDSLSSRNKAYNSEERYFKFEFDQPSNSTCDEAGTRCGFIVKFSRDGVDFKCELCREPEIYQGTGIHIHDNICVEDMYLYWIVPGVFNVEIEEEVREIKEISVPVRWGWWYWFNGAVDSRKIEKFCVEYSNVRPSDLLARC